MNVWRNKWAQGEVVVIRYADDTIVGFQYQADADRFLENLGERLAMFGLELHPDKTRRIEFGRFAEQNRKRRFAASERCNRSVDVTRRYHSLAERVMLVSRGR